MTTPSELVPVAPGALKLAKEGANLAQVMEAMLDGARPVPSDAEVSTKVPVPIGELGDEARQALQALPGIFGKINLGGHRPLTEAELAMLGQEDLALRAVLKDFSARAEQIKDLVRIHADAAAMADGLVTEETPVDDKGRYLLATEPKGSHRVHIPGTRKDWSLEYHGNGVEYDLAGLQDLLANGEITRAEFNAMTRPVVDTANISSFLTRKPARALEILARITRIRTPSNYLYVRNQK